MSATAPKRSSSFDQPRVKQKQQRTNPICEPCRARVTRCDRQRPCSSCILANTQSQCYPDAATYQPPPSYEVSRSPARRRSQSYRVLGAPMGRRGSDGQQLYEGSTAVIATLVPLTDDSPEMSLAPIPTRKPRRQSYRRDNNLDILSKLPPGDVCERVVDYYFEHCTWLYKYFDRRAFSERFHQWRTGEETDSLTIAGIAIICAIVVHCLPPHHELANTLQVFPNYKPLPSGASAQDIQSARERAHADTSVNHANAIGAQFYDTCQLALDREKTEDKVHVWTMDFMEVVLGKCHYLGLSKVDTEELWSLRGELVTMATALGLHRYPASEVSHHVAERHRWLWGNIIFLERWQALMHGRPPSILPEHFDVKPPSPDAVPLPTPQSESDPTAPQSFLGRNQSTNSFNTPTLNLTSSAPTRELVDKDISIQKLLALSLDPDVPLVDPSEEARLLKESSPSSSSPRVDVTASNLNDTPALKSAGSRLPVSNKSTSVLDPRTLPGPEEGGTRTYEAHVAHFNLAYILGRVVDDVLRLSPVVYSRIQSHDDDLQRFMDELAPSLKLTTHEIAHRLVSHYTGWRRQGVQALVVKMAALHVRFMLHRPYVSGEIEDEPLSPAYELPSSAVSTGKGKQRESDVSAYLRAQKEKDHRRQVRVRADEHATSLAKAIEAAQELIDLSVVTVPKMTHANACAEHAHLNWAPVQVTGAALFLIYVVVTSPTPRSEDDEDMRPSSPQLISASSSASSNATRPYPSLNALRLLPTIRRALRFLQDISFISTAHNSASLLLHLEPLFSETFVFSSKEERIKTKKKTLLDVQRLNAPYRDGGTFGIVGGQQTPPSPVSPVARPDVSAPATSSEIQPQSTIASTDSNNPLPPSAVEGPAAEPQMPPPPPPPPKGKSGKATKATRTRREPDATPRKRNSIPSTVSPAASTSKAPPLTRAFASTSALKSAPQSSLSALPSISPTKTVSFEADGLEIISPLLPPPPLPGTSIPASTSAPVPSTRSNAPIAGLAQHHRAANIPQPAANFSTFTTPNSNYTSLPNNLITPVIRYGHTDLYPLFGGHPRGAPDQATQPPAVPTATPRARAQSANPPTTQMFPPLLPPATNAPGATPMPSRAMPPPPVPARAMPPPPAPPLSASSTAVIHHAAWPPPPPPRSAAMFNSVFPGPGAHGMGAQAGAQQQQQQGMGGQQPMFGMDWSGAERRGVYSDMGLDPFATGQAGSSQQLNDEFFGIGEFPGANGSQQTNDGFFGSGGFPGANV